MSFQFHKSINVFLFCFVISFGSHAQAAEYGGGSGTEADPYHICTPQQMNTIGAHSEDWDKHFKLMDDIDMSAYTGTEYNIIGNSATNFTGTFEGNGHVISNLTIARPTQDYIGLFGYLGDGGRIQNLSVENINITGRDYVGTIVGFNTYSSITACYVTGWISGNGVVGGLVGFNNSGTIISCYTAGSVNSIWGTAGGLVGFNRFTITSCCSTSSVNGGSSCIGGLVGNNDNLGNITFCYSTGSVSGYSDIGGLSGYNAGTIKTSYTTCSVDGSYMEIGGLVGYNAGTITGCYATGSSSGFSDVGGLSGGNSGSITSCFWNTQASSLNDGVGNQDPDPSGVIGKTTSEMQTLSTFTTAGWDFTNECINGTNDFWRMCIDGVDYPRLNWEFTKGDFACPYGVNIEDLYRLPIFWMRANCSPINNYCGGADLNYSGVVDIADWTIFAENWLKE